MRKYQTLLHQFFQIGKKFRKSFFIQKSGIKRFQIDMKNVFPRQRLNVGFIQSGELDPAFREFLRCISFIPDFCHIQNLQRWCLQNQNQSDKQNADPKIPPDGSFLPRIKQRKKNTTRDTNQKIAPPKEKPEFPEGKGRIHLKNSDIAKRLLRNIGTGYKKTEIIKCLRQQKEYLKSCNQKYPNPFFHRKIEKLGCKQR